jgi:hypothetical protein
MTVSTPGDGLGGVIDLLGAITLSIFNNMESVSVVDLLLDYCRFH